ncbi:hypothetical protein JRO89_XS03G0018100 [Xanthoceras sorbifolium]|uniref:non-specific serine/threonine protein kinase n=1 Tax=Xanthoceras sorbifolium TaxID=99658 RepID=A0ABQ8I854_9ROSI|nr:hypothetical protein JRO89_XS03G0018100 [Xanthoceras sorbifolium]
MSSIAISYGENGPIFCGLKSDRSHLVTCYGSNSAVIYGTPAHFPFIGLTAGDGFVCGLLMDSNQPYCWGSSGYIQMGVPQPMIKGAEYLEIIVCWGDETSSRVISLIPKEMKFLKIAAGGYHVCGILEGVNSRAFCWGRSLDLEEEISVAYSGEGNVDLPPKEPLLSVVGGKFHACGIKSYDHGVICWGFLMKPSAPPPSGIKLYEIAAGNYFTCGVLAEKSLQPVCWGVGFPTSLPLAVSPGLCRSTPCPPGSYEVSRANATLQVPWFPPDCFSNCSSLYSNGMGVKKNEKFWSMQLPVIIAEIAFAVFLITVVSLTAVLYVRYKLRNCHCSTKDSKSRKINGNGSSYQKDNGKIRPDLDELKIRRAQMFTYEELERATGGFKEESQVGRGSFSCVYKGILKDGTVVAVKKAIMSSDRQKNSKEFHTELDLLSRLNHAHLLNLLGYCEEGGERLLVYEFMAHGSLHQHLHGKKAIKEQLDWVRRVTIAVQAARGIEYLHGYACPPVIHRDIKSSNILIDEEHNARVADFGLSLLGPADSGSPLAELPAGTLGYLDPEYYRLHYLTTKSDVYSFGVLLLEILSGRKAIDMQYEEGNIVEWAVPLIKAGDVTAILDPLLKPPSDLDALKRIANVASKCVRMRGKERPSMDKVTTALERALAQLMGSPCTEQPILPTEVVLGSNRMHKKSSQRSSNRSASETDVVEAEDQRFEFRAPSWITFPSVTSSQRRKSSVSEADVDGKTMEARNVGSMRNFGDGLRSLEEEIGPASPQQNLFLQHNF